MAEKILVVEDARMFSRVLKSRLEERGFDVVVAETLKNAMREINHTRHKFMLALVDLNLPDAPDGEIVTSVTQKKLPCIVFTGQFSDELREQMLQKNVVDYVTKEDPSSIDFVVDLVCRIHHNRKIQVLVVDDSPTARKYLVSLLKAQLYQVAEAKDGEEALALLDGDKDNMIKVVLTDYMMPNMDGFELTKTLRRNYSRGDLAIIGISGHGNNILSAKFIKNGASDFISKPFLVEEFQCRVSQNVELLSHINALRETITRDYLTGLHNRRYLFSTGQKLFASAVRKHISLTTALIDIDYFKKINDIYGHDGGDEVLKALSLLLQKNRRETDIVARIGGEEFCLLLVNMARDKVSEFLETLRLRVESHTILHNKESLKVKISIGATIDIADSLDETIAQADHFLYMAKKNGRNRVVIG